MKKIEREILLIIFLIIFLFGFSSVSAIDLNLNYPQFGDFDINEEGNQDVNKIIAWFYYFVVSIAGLAAFVMLVWGGFTWLTSTGEPGKITDAKDRIYSAFLGLLLILTSYLIIKVINPELTILTLP